MKNKILNRFLNYIKFDTQASATSNLHPSTPKQKELGEYLVKELHSLGINNAYMDEVGYVYAKVLGTNPTTSVGLIAHMDTALELGGKVDNPNIIDNYQGEKIILKNNITLDTVTFPRLASSIGHTIVTTDGTTLLGGDDKAGIAIIMSTLELLLSQKDYSYPNIYIAFTPDEEIGEGTLNFNYDFFKADFAYTLDGGEVFVINYENFNAASASVTFTGKSIHPGSAKGKMVNSQLLAMEFQAMLPNIRPENTENYEGFNHLSTLSGSVAKSEANYIIRNHDKEKFKQQIDDFLHIEKEINKKYGYEACKVDITLSYQNMKEMVDEKPYVLEYPVKALKELGYDPLFIPIRGGTDGANLSYNGIVCPNIGTGVDNMHGPYEYADIDKMNEMIKLVIKMLDIIAK